MAKKAKEVVVAKPSQSDLEIRYELAQSKLSEENRKLILATEECKEEVYQEWKALGGCEACDGWGRVLGWWTLDGCGYDEFKSCPEEGKFCNENTRKAIGINPKSLSPGSGGNRYAPPFNEERFPRLGELRDSIEAIEAESATLEEQMEIKIGSFVQVFRGVKFPRGTQGFVRWIGTSEHRFARTNVGLQVEGQEKLSYVCIDNVAVVAVPQEVQAKLEDKQNSLMVERDRLVEKFSLPDLVGSPKQVGWAENIRQNLALQVENLGVGSGEVARARLRTEKSAKAWIDNRFAQYL